MKIPGDKEGNALTRLSFYRDIISACFYSYERRVEQYQTLKNFYLAGCDQGQTDQTQAPYNKIEPLVDTITAFLYSADSTRFSGHLGPEVHESEWEKVPALSEAINSDWTNSGADQLFSQAVDWSMVYNSMFTKWVVKGKHAIPYIVEPHCLGVYREDLNGLDRQEAIAHRYYITRSQLAVELASHPERESILAKLAPRPIRPRDEMPEVMRRIIVTNMTGSSPLSPGNTVTGAVPGWPYTNPAVDYVPAISADVIEMTELWVKDDDLNGDYRTVTLAEQVVVYDRSNIFVPDEQPFTQVCPYPMHGYFWGRSGVGKILNLQGWFNVRIDEIQRILALQAKPPTALTGWSGMIDETNFALDQPGGVLANSDPMGKVDRFAPKVPEDLWSDVGRIEEMFMEAMGLPPTLMGRGETGVRSGRQTSELSRLGSSRTKKRALTIEDSLEAFATKRYKVMRKYDDTAYMTKPTKAGTAPVKFIAEQAPDDLVIKVDGHSNSPLFMEDQKVEAQGLFEAKAINRSRLVKMVNPPMKDEILKELPAIEAQEAAAAKAKADHELQMTQAKHAPEQGGQPAAGGLRKVGG